VIIGLLLATGLIILGIVAGWSQVRLQRRLQEQPFVPAEDQRYYRGQGGRRFVISVLLTIIGSMIGTYYLSGMDDRLVAIPERLRQATAQAGEHPPNPAQEAEATDERRFTRLVGYYWIVVIVLLGIVVMLAGVDVIATRRYWMARYRELRADHQARLHRDLILFRQRRLQSRFRPLPRSQSRGDPPPDDTDTPSA
jgi:hypothetical protein